MRVRLIGQVRRVWAPRGVKIRQRVERCYEWAYLHLAANGIAGRLDRQWTTNLKQEFGSAGGAGMAGEGDCGVDMGQSAESSRAKGKGGGGEVD